MVKFLKILNLYLEMDGFILLLHVEKVQKEATMIIKICIYNNKNDVDDLIQLIKMFAL